MRTAANGRNIWLVGGGELVGLFYDAGLLDEIIVQVGSVALAQASRSFLGKSLSPAQARFGTSGRPQVCRVDLRGTQWRNVNSLNRHTARGDSEAVWQIQHTRCRRRSRGQPRTKASDYPSHSRRKWREGEHAGRPVRPD
jgi:hypothetical protein